MRRPVGRFALALVLALSLPGPASAEKVVIHAKQPAAFSEPAQLRRLVVSEFRGRGGSTLTAALRQALAAPGPDGPPYFAMVTTSDRKAETGIVTGNVQLNVTESAFTRPETRCIDGSLFKKCKQKQTVILSCTERVVSIVPSVTITRASDGRVLYTSTKPSRGENRWCENTSPPDDIDTQFLQVAPSVAQSFVQDIAPHTTSYEVRLLETRKGLTKPAAAIFKSGVLISPKDFASSCRQWNSIASERAASFALEFNLGLCAEQAGSLAEAEASYARALGLAPSNKTIAEGLARVRSIASTRAQAIAQAQQRAAAEAEERRAIEAAARATANAEKAARAKQAAERRRAAASAAAAAKAAKAKQAEQRQQVTNKFGAKAADNILAGTVTKGMTAAEVRAATGGGCRIQKLAPGEEQWFCGAKRIVFSSGRVTFVR